MAKTKISEYDSTAANNTDVDGINIAESCPPSGINNAIREVMAHLKDFQSGTSGDTLPLTAGGTGATTASGVRTAIGLGALAVKSTVATADIDADAINNSKIADDSIDSEHIVDGAIDTVHIGDDQITTAKIAENAITTTELNVSGTGTAGQSLVSDGDGSFSWATAGGIGVGQTWQNVTASRAFGILYTNTTGKPIFISVYGIGSPNHGTIQMFVDGISMGVQGVNSVASAGMSATMTAIVPNGSTYQVNNVLGASLISWAELR
jgi:hypothetical protein